MSVRGISQVIIQDDEEIELDSLESNTVDAKGNSASEARRTLTELAIEDILSQDKRRSGNYKSLGVFPVSGRRKNSLLLVPIDTKNK